MIQAPCKRAGRGLEGSTQEDPPLYDPDGQHHPDVYLPFSRGCQCQVHVLRAASDRTDMGNTPLLGKFGSRNWMGPRQQRRGSKDSNEIVGWYGLGQ